MFTQIVSMKRITVTLFVAAMMSSAAMGESFNLAQAPYPGSEMIAMTWTSPGNGTVTISGNASANYGGNNVWVDYVMPGYVPPLSIYTSSISVLGGSVPGNLTTYQFGTPNILVWNTPGLSVASTTGSCNG